MGTRKHKQAKKEILGAVATFSEALTKVNKAIELTEESIIADEKQMAEIEAEISTRKEKLNTLYAGILIKKDDIKQHQELAKKLSEFSL